MIGERTVSRLQCRWAPLPESAWVSFGRHVATLPCLLATPRIASRVSSSFSAACARRSESALRSQVERVRLLLYRHIPEGLWNTYCRRECL